LVFDAGGQPSDNEVEQLLENVEKYKLASHLFWGLWGIVSVCLPILNF
jgi:choline/ethanolamine kinase